MDGYDEVTRGPSGFSYETKMTEGMKGETWIRDARDELFATVEYLPASGQYTIEIDGGYTTREDLEELGLLEALDLEEIEEPDMTGVLGSLEPDNIGNWRRMTYGVRQQDDDLLEVENIDSPDIKTHIRLISPDEEIASAAEKFATRFSNPATESDRGDPYGESWAPFKENSTRVRSAENENTLEQVFGRAISITEDMLEQRKQNRK